MITADDRLWTTEDVSRYLGVPVNTLYRWRTLGMGLRPRVSAATCGTCQATSSLGCEIDRTWPDGHHRPLA